jgi:galactan 5-O-arabinofuranosyltransferase
VAEVVPKTLQKVLPYKPATYMVLIALLPVLISLARALRQSPGWTWRRCAVVGAVLGVVLGLLFLSYSGWFVWSAPGALVAMLLLFPWRESIVRGLVLLGTSAAAFAVVAAVHLVPLLRGAGSVKDTYFYFDVLVEPAYIAMWRNDFAGGVTTWPPPGELGGVGLFTVVLVTGLGAALWIGARHALVVVTACVLASAWVIRFVVAAAMHETGTVQLWPRTTMQILYCLVVLTGYALLLGLNSVRTFAADGRMFRGGDHAGPAGRSHQAVPAVAVLGAAALLFASAGSAAADRYMPRNDDSTGYLAWVAHTTRTQTGDCPSRAPAGECR